LIAWLVFCPLGYIFKFLRKVFNTLKQILTINQLINFPHISVSSFPSLSPAGVSVRPAAKRFWSQNVHIMWTLFWLNSI